MCQRFLILKQRGSLNYSNIQTHTHYADLLLWILSFGPTWTLREEGLDQYSIPPAGGDKDVLASLEKRAYLHSNIWEKILVKTVLNL